MAAFLVAARTKPSLVGRQWRLFIWAASVGGLFLFDFNFFV
jgi:hypothetical protein